jgi:hypothetical protein
VARWQLASSKVHPGSISGVLGWHRARRRGRERRERWVNVWWWSGGGTTVLEGGGGGFSVVSDDATAALHLREGERMVRGA